MEAVATDASKLIRGGASDWEAAIGRTHPRCGACERALGPGDELASILVFDEGALVRRDVCPSHLDERPELADGAYARWRSRIPLPDEGKPRPLDVDFLADFFRRLQKDEADDRREVAYIVALLLIRKKILRQVGSEREGDAEVLVLTFVKGEDDAEHRVRVPELSEAKMDAIRGDLGRIFNL